MPRILMLRFEDLQDEDPPQGLDSATELTLRTIPGAPRERASAPDWSLADLAVMAAGQDAQEQGFDALCLPAFGDYGVGALRSLLDIPVVTGGRGTMLHALTLGSRFGIVTPEQGRERAARLVHDYGLSAQCAGIAPSAAAGDDALLEACRHVLAAGAQVICLADYPQPRAAALAAQLPVPLLTPAALCAKWAESLLGLGLAHSRRAYPAPQVRKPELIAALIAASAGDATA